MPFCVNVWLSILRRQQVLFNSTTTNRQAFHFTRAAQSLLNAVLFAKEQINSIKTRVYAHNVLRYNSVTGQKLFFFL